MNQELVVTNDQNNEDILKSVLLGQGQKPHEQVVALNTALVLWAAGQENNLDFAFKKAYKVIKESKAWTKFLKLKDHLE